MIELASEKELKEFTGYKQLRCQMTWLRRNGINEFFIGGDGKIKLLKRLIEQKCGIKDSADGSDIEPDYSSLHHGKEKKKRSRSSGEMDADPIRQNILQSAERFRK
ncbi:MAG: DUF4224 domain-containing protein [Pseudomonadota bacterium]